MDRLITSCFAFSLIMLHGAVASADQVARIADSVSNPLELRRAGPLTKADSALASVYADYRARLAEGVAEGSQSSSKAAPETANLILVDARAISDGSALLAELQELGLSRGSHFGNVVSGLLPVSAIEAALELPGLRAISASPPPITHAGSITSQGDIGLRADIARATYGVDGTGITVGIISDAYDSLGGAAADIASGDLPSGGVTVLNGESTLCGTLIFCIDEGRAMAQIVHDMAPGADILFHSGVDGIAAYANAIAALANAGADVIVDDLLIINEPMFQDGVIAQAIDSVVASDVTYFSAAGNAGRRSYESAFDDSGEIFCIEFFEPIGDCDPMFERVGSMHDFDPGPGVDNFLNFTLPVDSVMTIAMQWDQPFGGAGPQTDHDIVLLDGAGETYITGGISANDNIIMGESWEALQFSNAEVLYHGTEFSIAITYDDVDSIGPPASLIKLVVFGEDAVLHEWTTNGSTTYGHANAAGAETVGAAFFLDTPEFGVSPPQLQPYSSAGGTPILFNIDGSPKAEPEIRQKPNITAIDGVNTTFFFDDRHGDDGVDDFFGTSAAAPHAAGIAALLLDAKPEATVDEIRAALEDTAIDMGVAGVDSDSGHGLIQADAAVAQMLIPAPGRQSLVTIPDRSGNSIAEVAVLRDNSRIVEIREGQSGALLRNLDFLSAGYTPYTIASVPDSDGDGAAELALLASRDSDGRMVVELRNVSGTESPRSIWFAANHEPVALAVVADDADANGIAELAVLSARNSDGRGLVEVKNVFGPTNTNAIWAGAGLTPSDVEVIADKDANSVPEIAILSTRNSDGRIVVEIKNASGATQPNAVWFAPGHTAIDLVAVDDKDNNGIPEVAVLSSRDSDGRNVVEIKNASGVTASSAVWFQAGMTATAVKQVDDADNNGIPEVAVLAERDSDGRILVEVKNASGATNPNPIWFASGYDARGLATIADTDGNSVDETLVLMIRDSDGRILVQGRNAAGSPTPKDYWFLP
jgi:hypothetical protein